MMGSAKMTRGHIQTFLLRSEPGLPFSRGARPHCRQMDSLGYSSARRWNQTLCRLAERNWRNLTENADPNSAEPRAGWPRRAEGLSSRPTKG